MGGAAELMEQAVLPWRSAEALDVGAQTARLPFPSEQDVEICMLCPHCAEACNRCDGRRNVKEASNGKRGRPRKEIDEALFRRMMQLRRCNKDMCAALRISERTLISRKKDFTNAD